MEIKETVVKTSTYDLVGLSREQFLVMWASVGQTSPAQREELFNHYGITVDNHGRVSDGMYSDLKQIALSITKE